VRLIGLTGGIATGKSTVSAMLRALGARILDADEIAREVVEPGTPGLSEIAERFPGVVAGDGRLDRAALGALVFANEGERRALNAILHPRIQEAFIEKTQRLASEGIELVIYDAALLIENALHQVMDGVILVIAPMGAQITRLVQRNGLSEQEARARIAAQLPLSEKQRHATWVIDNGGSVEATRLQVERLWAEINAMLPRP
jgi:dephospho-CoA kinase